MKLLKGALALGAIVLLTKFTTINYPFEFNLEVVKIGIALVMLAIAVDTKE